MRKSYGKTRDRLMEKGMEKHEAEMESARIHAKSKSEEGKSRGQNSNRMMGKRGDSEVTESKTNPKAPPPKHKDLKGIKKAEVTRGPNTHPDRNTDGDNMHGKNKDLNETTPHMPFDGPLASSPGYPLAGHEVTFPANKDIPRGKKSPKKKLMEEGQSTGTEDTMTNDGTDIGGE